MKYLFLGGDHDGRRIELASELLSVPLTRLNGVGYEVYVPEEFWDADSARYVVYVLSGGAEQPLRMLLEGYGKLNNLDGKDHEFRALRHDLTESFSLLLNQYENDEVNEAKAINRYRSDALFHATVEALVHRAVSCFTERSKA